MDVKERIIEEDDKLIVQRWQTGLREHVDYCQARANEGYHGPKGMKLKASIPAVIIEDYLNRNGITFAEFTRSREHKRRLLNDPALAYFRIAPGRY